MTAGRAKCVARARVVHRDAWRSVPAGFALEDSDRHLGHVINAGARHWLAFDATHLNESGRGFRFVGIFGSDVLAREAVERSIVRDFR